MTSKHTTPPGLLTEEISRGFLYSFIISLLANTHHRPSPLDDKTILL